jgi:hypothetical protein
MQGNDRPGCRVSNVSLGPIVPRSVEWEELPEAYDKRLVDKSNECLIDRSKTLLPQLRDVLSQLAWTKPEQLSLLLKNDTAFEGNELVHTSYFLEPAILDLISCHILRHNHVKAPRADSKSATARWCQKFRHKARDVSRDATLQEAGLPLLGQRNIRALIALTLVFLSPVLAIVLVQEIGMSGMFFPVLPFLLARSSVRRAKRGARSPRVAKWAWRFSVVALVLLLPVLFLAQLVL